MHLLKTGNFLIMRGSFKKFTDATISISCAAGCSFQILNGEVILVLT